MQQHPKLEKQILVKFQSLESGFKLLEFAGIVRLTKRLGVRHDFVRPALIAREKIFWFWQRLEHLSCDLANECLRDALGGVIHADDAICAKTLATLIVVLEIFHAKLELASKALGFACNN